MSQCIIVVGCKQSVIPFPAGRKMELPFPFDNKGKRKRKMAEASSSSSPARTIDKRSFDVFLSFRGEDTRKGFTSHLYNARCQRGISTFIDSEELERGERIEELFNYIEASKIFVLVLSEGYADSRWCMREITKMVECGRLIIPIFFYVNPRDVRKQSGTFKLDKSSKGVGEEDLGKWKGALKAVGEISGYSFQNDTNENEAHLIQNVVEQISRKLNKNARPITEHLVGMDSHIGKMYRLLDLTDEEVKMIGIVGMGGVGKTTIATVVYNMLLSHFEDSSFIKDVREGFKQHNGGVALQQRLIKDILKVKDPDVADVEAGKSLIEERLRSKKVLVTLDDADHIEQLEALAGKRNWFGSRSRIIITSRDSGVLLNHGVKEEDIYKPELLDDENSLKLFISHAFHAFPVIRSTESEYVELAMKFVQVSGRLPLALTVFGSLVRRRNIKQWKEILEKLIQVPNKDVDGKLMISYDGLEENVKQIFVDISCFFIGKQKEYATYMWKDCGLCPETAITELQERSLINVNKYDEFEMHDLLRDMGRGIAQQGEHWQWSRLSNLDDLRQSLAYKDKPRMVKGIVMAADYTPANDSETYLSTQDFVDFSLLRLLHLSGFAFKGEFLLLPKRLKWLRLYDCIFLNGLSGASTLNAISVLELIHVDEVDRILMELSSSSIKAFDALKVLHLEYSGMTRTPDFSRMKCLVHLDLRHCDELQKLPDSICTLMSLETLILVDCKSLSSLPEKLGDMKSLKMLRAENTGIRAIPDSIGDLSNLCTLSLLQNYELEKLPDSMRMMDSLKKLYTDHFSSVVYWFGEYNVLDFSSELRIEYVESYRLLAVVPNSACKKVIKLSIWNEWIQELPPYFGRLTNLEALSIRCRKLRSLPEWLGQLQKLKSFELISDSLKALPASARTLENLRSLKLECRTLKHGLDLDLSLTQTVTYSALFFLSNLAQLQELRLEFCDNLQSLPPLPSSLHVLNARGCDNLRTISDVSNLKSLRELILGGCRLLGDFCGLESIAHNLETLELPGPWGGLSGFSKLSPAFMTRIFKGAAFSSLKKFCVCPVQQTSSWYYREAIACRFDRHQPFWLRFQKWEEEGNGQHL